jgi:hypothetical protein
MPTTTPTESTNMTTTTRQTDYAALTADLWAAFKADTFDWADGSFQRTREMDAGSIGWPRRYMHTFSVPAHQKTREALVARGLVEAVPDGMFAGTRWRLTASACFAHRADRVANAPSWQAWQARHLAERAV